MSIPSATDAPQDHVGPAPAKSLWARLMDHDLGIIPLPVYVILFGLIYVGAALWVPNLESIRNDNPDVPAYQPWLIGAALALTACNSGTPGAEETSTGDAGESSAAGNPWTVATDVTIDGSPRAADSPVAHVVFPVPGGPTSSIGGSLVPAPAVARAPCIAATDADRIQGARS